MRRWMVVPLLGCCGLAIAGCAQDDEAMSWLGQDTTTPTVQRITYEITNGPADRDRGNQVPPTTQPWTMTRESPDSGEGTTVSSLPAGAYNQLVIIWTDTGSNAQASGQQTGDQTASPTQDVRPEASVAVPVGVALPGGISSPQAVATGRGSTSGTEQANQQDANAVLTWLKANPEWIPKIMQAIAEYIQQVRSLPTTPSTAPAETTSSVPDAALQN